MLESDVGKVKTIILDLSFLIVTWQSESFSLYDLFPSHLKFLPKLLLSLQVSKNAILKRVFTFWNLSSMLLSVFFPFSYPFSDQLEFCVWSWWKLSPPLPCHRIIEYPTLEGMHRDHWVQILPPHPMFDSVVQMLPELLQLGAMTTALGSLFHAHHTTLWWKTFL